MMFTQLQKRLGPN